MVLYLFAFPWRATVAHHACSAQSAPRDRHCRYGDAGTDRPRRTVAGFALLRFVDPTAKDFAASAASALLALL